MSKMPVTFQNYFRLQRLTDRLPSKTVSPSSYSVPLEKSFLAEGLKFPNFVNKKFH